VGDIVLVCEKPDGLKVYIEPDAVESVEEILAERTRSIPEDWPAAVVVTASGARHTVKDPERQVGPRWVRCKQVLLRAREDG
jgi:hypothetical protein